MTKAKLSTEVQAPTAPAPAVELTPTTTLLPPTLRLFGPVINVLAELVVHARLGYTLDAKAPVDQFSQAGNISMFLRLGTPEDSIVKLAQATVQDAAAAQRAAYARDVVEAARQMVADEAKAKKAAEVQAQIAATKATIKALEASLQA